MEFTFAGKKSLTQQPLGAYECAALGKILLIRDEHVADEIRMVEQVNPLIADFEEHNVAVFFRGLDHEREPAAREPHQHVTGEASGWPRWGAAIWHFARHRVSATSVIRAI